MYISALSTYHSYLREVIGFEGSIGGAGIPC